MAALSVRVGRRGLGAIAAALAFAPHRGRRLCLAISGVLAPRFMAASVDDKLANAPRLSIVVPPFEI